jgi:hypothetical protein
MTTEVNPQGAVKFDSEKRRVELLPLAALDEVIDVMTYGAKKYGDNNWIKGMEWGRLSGAAFRHLIAWCRGEKCDPETSKSHLAHLICCALFLIYYEKFNIGKDTRLKDPKEK